MHKNSQQRKRMIPRAICALLIGGGVAVTYQIKCLKERFSSLLSEEAIERESKRTSSYIEVPQMLAEVPVSSMVSKFLSMEQLMETLIKGPKSLGNDNNPWHLIRILKSDRHVRDHSLALKTLATSHYNVGLSQQIAQACGLKIAVKLARSQGVNLNLFLQPPAYLVASAEPIEDELLRLLTSYPESDDHKCADYFLRAALKLSKKEKHEEHFFSWDLDAARLRHPKSTAQIVELYLQALLQQSRSLENSETMVKSGVLPVLWRVIHQFTNEASIKSLCVRIVANISKFTPLHVHIFQSGWVGKLAEFMRSESLFLSLSAGKALANMDEVVRKFGIYDGSVYLLHPLFYEDESEEYKSTRRSVNHDTSSWDMDVVFVHGLLGGVGWTWRQSEALGVGGNFSYCWPKDWLPKDVPNLRVLGIDYATSLSHWRSRCPDDIRRSSIASRANEILTSLKEAGVGRRPIVWVGHSMGGLLVKQLLVSASNSDDVALQKIASSSKAVLMLSVPHDGSNVASLNSTVRFFLLPSVEVEELRKGSDMLGNLNSEFKKLLETNPLALVSVVETKSTLVQPWGLFKFVEPSSTDLLSSDEVHFLPVDHFEICKPLNRKSFVYQRLVKLLWGVRGGSPPKDLVRPTQSSAPSANQK